MKSTLLVFLIFLSGSNLKHPSIYSLISNPVEYFEDSLKVCGYLAFRFEDKSLWSSKEAFENNITPNSLSVNLVESDSLFGKYEKVLIKRSRKEKHGLDGRYVCVEGRFHESPKKGEVGTIQADKLRLIHNEAMAREFFELDKVKQD